jgi:hypothetical protein
MADTLEELAKELASCEYGAPTLAEYNGMTFRAKFEIDEDSSIFDDGDWYGALAWVKTERWSGRPSPRPDGFDGAALKLQTRGGDPIWWQPPADIVKDPENVAAMRSTILDILEYGYHGIVLERCDGTDAYGRPIVVAFTSLWGMAGYDDDGHAFVIADMLGEVMPEPATI